jgi:tetratricopeptide (TPR) repeat protein
MSYTKHSSSITKLNDIPFIHEETRHYYELLVELLISDGITNAHLKLTTEWRAYSTIHQELILDDIRSFLHSNQFNILTILLLHFGYFRGRTKVVPLTQREELINWGIERILSELQAEENCYLKRLLTLYYNSLGLVYFDKKEYPSAFDAFDKAIKIEPNYAIAHGNKGEICLATNQYESAIVYCTTAVEIEPNYQRALQARAVSNYKSGYKVLGLRDILLAYPSEDRREIELFKLIVKLRNRCNLF